MKILILSKLGVGLGIGHRLSLEGHSVKVWIQEPGFDQAGDGIVDRVTSWRPYVKSSDLVICASVGLGYLEETIKGFGKPVLCCNSVADLIAKDEDKINQFLSHYNLSYGDTEEHVDISIEGWFNGRSWLSPFFLSFINRHFMVDGLGPDVGCAGLVTMAISDVQILDNTVMKITPFLQKTGYRGPISLHGRIGEESLDISACLPGIHYDTIYNVLEGIQEPAGDLFFEVASGGKKQIEIGNDFMIAIRLTIPPWPHISLNMDSAKISGINKHNEKHIFLNYVTKADDGYKSVSGNILTVTAKGRSLREARNRALRTIKNLSIPDLQYRTDIGLGVEEKIKMLKHWGYL